MAVATEHFGILLKSLRELRGMTMQQMASIARLSPSRLARAEAASECIIKRSTAVAILDALETNRALTPDQRARYVQAAGLAELMRVIDNPMGAGCK